MSQLPKELDTSELIIFLGSGFSRSAQNVRNKDLPVGNELRKEFAKLLNVSSNDYDLKTLADEIHSHHDLNLYQILYELFTVKRLDKYQREILRLPWRRIYTTNYDDAVELCFLENKNNAPSFNYDDKKPNRLPSGAIIHLHGVIRRTNRENVLDQLILNESSYVRQHFEKSPWYDDFERDLRFCSSCFFVGYSLSDYHVSALLMKNSNVCRKTYFITHKIYDKIFANRVRPYGEILPIELKGFAELCKTLPKPAPNRDPYALKAFQFLDPLKDKKTLAPPTPVEILNLVAYGTFNYQRCLSTLPDAEYVVPRQEVVDDAAIQLRDARRLLVQLLHSFRKLAIFFDSYNLAIDLIDQFNELPSDAKFIIAVRTSVHDVRLHEVQSRLPTPLGRVSLNGIQKQDADNFKKILDRSGIRAQNLESVIDQCRDFREVVLALYDNRKINEKITTELGPLLQDQSFRKVFIVSHLLKWAGQDVDAAFLRSVTHSNAFAEIAKFREITGDIFRLDDGSFQVRSAVFSQYLIKNHLTTMDIVECVYGIIVEAVKRKSERRYQAILSSLIRFSWLNTLLSNDQHRLGSLKDLFDRLHRDIDVNREPLFWLQYSILMAADDNLRAAEDFMRTAYDRAEKSPSFQTFQIDTYALKLLLLIEQREEKANSVARFEKIIEKMERVRSMIGDEGRRFHAVEVLEGIEPFISARISTLSRMEMNTLIYHLVLLIRSLDQLSPDDRAQVGSDSVRASLNRARERILAQSI